MGAVLVPLKERRSKRHAVRFECQVVRERDFALLGDCAVDLSTGGMLVMTDKRVLTGEDVLVSFRAPGLRTWFDVEAEVARVIHGRRGNDPGRALGLRFSRIDRVTKTYLRAGLASMPPAIPDPTREARFDYAETVTRILIGVDA